MYFALLAVLLLANFPDPTRSMVADANTLLSERTRAHYLDECSEKRQPWLVCDNFERELQHLYAETRDVTQERKAGEKLFAW